MVPYRIKQGRMKACSTRVPSLISQQLAVNVIVEIASNIRLGVSCQHDIAQSLHCRHVTRCSVLDCAQAPAMTHPRARTTAAHSRRLTASVMILLCRGIAMPPVAGAPLAPVSTAPE